VFKSKSVICCLFFFTAALAQAQTNELRGTWVAWAGSDYPEKTEIAGWMDALAAANINIVYVDVWRFGYPYFKSKVFYDLTGKWTDPGVGDRDILQEMIAEAHRVGIEVEAWFEAGFAATQMDNDDIYQVHPEWFAKRKNGTGIYEANGGIQYRWLGHCNQEAQQFLIDLALDVVKNYDIDGIEFDRIRYPDLDCGYDSATIELYRDEHNGNDPPANPYDSGWIRWRADKLNAFVDRLSNAVKSYNPDITMTNAPLWYGYEQFCQDWTAWINNDFLDLVSTQMYFASNDQYAYRLSIEYQKLLNPQKLYPGISTTANGVTTPPGELINMVQTTRIQGLPGHVIWYHSNLLSYLDTLSATVYNEPSELPYREAGWRKPAIIVNEDDPDVQKTDNWIQYENIPGYKGSSCLYANNSTPAWIQYSAEIPESGWYEVYVYIIQFFNAAREAGYEITEAVNADTVYVNQSKSANARWLKLGDYYFEKGGNRKIIRLTNENIGTTLVFTDAVMLLNTNRIIGDPTGLDETTNDRDRLSDGFQIGQSYPNPFNPATTIPVQLRQAAEVTVDVYDSTGRLVEKIFQGRLSSGRHLVRFDAAGHASGVYYYRVKADRQVYTGKMVLMK